MLPSSSLTDCGLKRASRSLAALDGGVSAVGSVPGGFSMFFHLHFFVMDPQVRGRRSFWLPFLLPALWVARFPTEQNPGGRCEYFIRWLFLSLSFFFSVNSSQKREESKAPQEEPREIQALAAWPRPFLSFPGASAAFRRAARPPGSPAAWERLHASVPAAGFSAR